MASIIARNLRRRSAHSRRAADSSMAAFRLKFLATSPLPTCPSPMSFRSPATSLQTRSRLCPAYEINSSARVSASGPANAQPVGILQLFAKGTANITPIYVGGPMCGCRETAGMSGFCTWHCAQPGIRPRLRRFRRSLRARGPHQLARSARCRKRCASAVRRRSSAPPCAR